MTANDSQHWIRCLAGYYADLLRNMSAAGSRHLHDLGSRVRYGLIADLSLFGVDISTFLNADCLNLDLKSSGSDRAGNGAVDWPEEPEGDEDVEEEANSERTQGNSQGSVSNLGNSGATTAEKDRTRSALRRIYRKQKSDPFNRETTIGYPIVAGRVGARRHVGPLLLWEVELSYEPRTQRLTVTKRADTPALNTVLLGKFSDQDSDLDLIREGLLPLILTENFDEAHIEEIIKALKGIFEPLRELREPRPETADASSARMQGPNRLPALLRAVSDLRQDEAPLLGKWPIITNGPRSFAFLLGDLDEISKIEDTGGPSVLEAVVGDVPEEGINDDFGTRLPFHEPANGEQPLWYPLKSNQSQRRTADKARRARVLTVQGPPGTGKTQTIANLICDLVTRGKAVLVTSHQLKALEVLTTKLPHIEHLAMSVLRSEKESMTRLKNRLEQVQELESEDLADLRDSVDKGEQFLRDLDRELRRLDRRYSELKQLEHEEHASHYRYHEVRAWDHLHEADRPDYGHGDIISKALLEWSQLVLQLAPALEQFDSLFRPDSVETTRAREAQIAGYLWRVLELVSQSAIDLPEKAIEIVDDALAAEADLKAAAEDYRDAAQWLRSAGVECLRLVKAATGDPTSIAALDDLIEVADIRGEMRIRREAGEWRETVQRVEGLSSDAREILPEVSAADRRNLKNALQVLRNSNFKLIPWIFSRSARRARAELEKHDIVLFRSTARQQVTDIDQALRWYRERDSLIEAILKFDEGLQVDGLPPVSQQASRPQLVQAAVCRAAIAEALDIIASRPQARYACSAGDSNPLGQLIRSVNSDNLTEKATLAEAVSLRMSRFQEIEALRQSSMLAGAWGEFVADILDALRDGGTDFPADSQFQRLQALLQAYPCYQRLLDLETVDLHNLRGTLRALRDGVVAERAIPTWLDRADLALEAHRLRQILLQSLAADPDDLTEIAHKLAEGQDVRRRAILEIVRRKRRYAASEAVRKPKIRVELLKLRRLLSRKRKTQSLITLKGAIDYHAVLKAFPCWICTIDDVARLFPLRAGLFDVLIVDEASQCNQATALPLAFRAKQMVVVGDRKQLRPATSRFLKQDVIDVLQQRHGIVDHPRAIFLNGRDSLIELAESCAEAGEFLNEHFRCDPAIIRWSNEQFYDNRLRIMTRRNRSDGRAPLEVRELTDADDDRDRKVNRREAEVVVSELRRIIDSGEAERMHLGIISPYRDQARLIDELLEREFKDRPELLRDHRIVSSTADGFQGDERDIILYSFRYGPSSDPGVVRAIQIEEERLNVAFTRAKKAAICFISHSLNRFPKGHIRSFLEHATKIQNLHPNGDGDGRADRFDSEFERDVCNRLRDRGYHVATQEPCARYLIDLVVEDGKGRQLAVECDGEWKSDPTGLLRPEDYQRQEILERAGWVFHRVSGRRYMENPERELERIEEALRLEPTAWDQALETGPKSKPVATVEPTIEEEEAAEPIVELPETQVDLSYLGSQPREQIKNVRRLAHWGLDRYQDAVLEFLFDVIGTLENDEWPSSEHAQYLRDLWVSGRDQGFDPEREDIPE